MMDEVNRRLTLYWLFKNAHLYKGSTDVIVGEFFYGFTEEELAKVLDGSVEMVRFYRDRGFHSLRYLANSSTKPRENGLGA